jgi:predicted dehydrogenase
MQPVEIALVGIGGYGMFYVRELLYAKPEVEFKFIAGIDKYPERSPFLSELREANIPIYTSLESFYQEHTADLVVISAPIHLHASLTCLALSHGSNVLCEKPVCATLEEADQMAEAERRSGKFVAIGYQWSFAAAIQSIKKDVRTGVLGAPKRLKTLILWPRSQSYYQRNDWAGVIKSPAGEWVLDSPVNNATAHYLHNMLYILGSTRETSAQPVSIQAELYRANRIENYDTAALRVITDPPSELIMLTSHAVPNNVGPLASYEFDNATVEFGTDQVFTAKFHDGRTIDYGDPDADSAVKLWQSIVAVNTGDRLACGIEAARPHTVCVNWAQKTPVKNFPTSLLKITGLEKDPLVWVEGLEEALLQAYSAGCLLSEVGFAP